ncbi:MAG: hypothetical protein R2828_08825 [Saprospiraceae bacterium]
MTLEELFQKIADNPAYVIFYFSIIPFAALLAGLLGKGEGDISPWKYLYSTLIYLVSVPGIFSVSLSIYFFLFEKRPILQTDIFTQVIPIVSMVATLLIIRKNVNLDYIPGFDKLSGLITMISATLAIMWFIDRTKLYVISFVRFEVVIGIFIALLVIIRYAWKSILGGSKE